MPRPHVILILADDMGYSDLGCFGGEIRTPNLDRLGREGVRMAQFYNTARCSPSRASMLTGRHPHETGVGILNDDDRPWGYPGSLATDVPTMAELLKEQGYATCLAGKWHLSSDTSTPNETWPTRRGFDSVYGILGGAGDYFSPRDLHSGEQPVPPPTDDEYYFTDAISEHAARFVGEAADRGQPFFLYLAYTAPHWPLHAHEEMIAPYEPIYAAGWDELRHRRFDRMRAEGILGTESALSERDAAEPTWDDAPDKEWEARRMSVYAAQVERMDRGIGVVLDAVAAAGRTEDTLVIFLSDNGACAETMPPADAPRFRERQPSTTVEGVPMRIGNTPEITPGARDTYASYGRAWANLSNTPFRLYKRWVHEGGIATPLIASWPAGGLADGGIIASAHQLTHLLPTVLDAVGAAPHDGATSMLPALRGENAPAETLYWEHVGNAAVRRNDHKAVRTAADGDWELYDLSRDRSETDDLAGRLPELLAELVSSWQAWADRVGVIPWPIVLEQRARSRDAVTPLDRSTP